MKTQNFVFKTHFQIAAIAVMFFLIAARPWGALNRTLGIVSEEKAVADSLASDSVYTVETPVVVLPPETADTLAESLVRRDSTHRALADSANFIDGRIKTLEKRIAAKRQELKKKEQELVSVDEINDLLTRQSKSQKQPGYLHP
nr:hypothetical protein [uncultured Arsenicibacter sp.]